LRVGAPVMCLAHVVEAVRLAVACGVDWTTATEVLRMDQRVAEVAEVVRDASRKCLMCEEQLALR
jgi:hypothetical protein